jgi:hypothetical protein
MNYFCHRCGYPFQSSEPHCKDCDESGDAVVPFSDELKAYRAKELEAEEGLDAAEEDLECRLATILGSDKAQEEFATLLMNELKAPWKNLQICLN